MSSFEMATGADLWTRGSAPGMNRFIRGADDKRVYVVDQPSQREGGPLRAPMLVALDAIDGTEQWRLPLAEHGRRSTTATPRPRAPRSIARRSPTTSAASPIATENGGVWLRSPHHTESDDECGSVWHVRKMSTSASPEPALVDVEEVATAVIRGIVDMGELAAFFDASFSRLAAAVAAQAVAVVGPAFALYHGAPGAVADLEVGFPTESTVEVDGDVVASVLPGVRVARLVHEGSFDQLGSSWGRLAGWIAAEGLSPGADLWEVYVTEPSPAMDPADPRTELNWPVTG